MLSNPSMHQSFNLAGHHENLDLSVNQFGNSLTHSQGSWSNMSFVHLGHFESVRTPDQTNKPTDKYNFLTRDLNVLDQPRSCLRKTPAKNRLLFNTVHEYELTSLLCDVFFFSVPEQNSHSLFKFLDLPSIPLKTGSFWQNHQSSKHHLLIPLQRNSRKPLTFFYF